MADFGTKSSAGGLLMADVERNQLQTTGTSNYTVTSAWTRPTTCNVTTPVSGNWFVIGHIDMSHGDPATNTTSGAMVAVNGTQITDSTIAWFTMYHVGNFSPAGFRNTAQIVGVTGTIASSSTIELMVIKIGGTATAVTSRIQAFQIG